MAGHGPAPPAARRASAIIILIESTLNKPTHARERLTTFLLASGLFLLNVYICRELFHIEYLRHMGSIEGAFIGMSRYITTHWNDLTWFPWWNAGAPFPTTYP